MGGFSSITGQDTIMNADNASFDGTERAGVLATNGQLWIGTTAVNAGGTHINVGSITSPGGTVTVGYSSPNITLDVAASGVVVEKFALQTGTTPVVPLLGIVTFNGSTVAAGTNPVRTNGTGANTMALQVQISQALAASDATKIGLANFNSAQFTVDANGFVSATGTVPIQFTTDSGTATPSAGNLNILGGPGVTTSGSGSTLTINSVVFTDTTATTMTVDTGFNATAAGTYNLPATAAQGEMIIIFCDTAGAVVVDAPALNFIRIGSAITSSGGTATSTAQGDSLTLRYRLSTLTWESVSVSGNWLVV